MSTQSPNLIDYIKIYDGVLTDKECDDLRALMDSNPQYHEVHETELYKFHQLNLNNVGLTELAKSFASLINDHYQSYIDELNLRHFMPDRYGFESVRIKRYSCDSDDSFKTHVDVMDHDSSKRFLIGLIYLDDNEAGETDFPMLNYKSECKKGRLVLFPPTWMFPHTGNPPIGKDKYIIMTSLNYL